MNKRQLPKSRLGEIKEFHTATSGIFFKPKRRIRSVKSPFQKIEIVETDSFGRILLLDGLVQTTEKDEFFYHEMLVHPAMSLHPAPRDVLVIGGGDGGALREVLRYPIRKAVLVEIDARVVEFCQKHFPALASSFRDRRVELLIDDGSRFIRESNRAFDVILVDSSDPVGPSLVLHQESFYASLKQRLRPGAIIAAQAGSPLFHLRHLRRKKAFLEKLFKFAFYYFGPTPTYPAGFWCYAFLSDRVNPLRNVPGRMPRGLRYYNSAIHQAAFALPEFMKR